MRRWPHILWPLIALATLLVLVGLGSGETAVLIPGIVLAVALLGAAVFLATRRSTGPDRQPGDVAATARERSLPGVEMPLRDGLEHTTAERVAEPGGRFRRGTRAGRW